jgi:hypothetical protein
VSNPEAQRQKESENSKRKFFGCELFSVHNSVGSESAHDQGTIIGQVEHLQDQAFRFS